MAIYHLSVQVISRGQGKSCVAAAAYRAAEKLHDERQGLDHDYTKKQDVESEIIAPPNTPNWVNDREKLWNEVDRSETRCNSRTAREINIALPLELSREQQKETVREYVKESFVDEGMVADVCFHFNDENNPHCHVMLTTRELNQEGFTKKKREWDKKENVEDWREKWAIHSNRALEKAGCLDRIDHRSYKDQGIDQLPTIHLGKTSIEIQKKGGYSPRIEINNQIKELNKETVIALQEYRELKNKLEEEKIKTAERYSNLKPEEKAAVLKVEELLKEPQTYGNSKKALDKINTMRQDEASKINKMDSEVREIERRLVSIKYSLDSLKKVEDEFKELPKNIFGKYKDKARAEYLKFTIQRYNNKLVSDGYKSSLDIKINEEKLENLRKNIGETRSKIKVLDQVSNSIREGVTALQNKELREFHIEYKEQFPQARYLSYNDMTAIRLVNNIMGRTVSIEEIRAIYSKLHERVDSINKELINIATNGRRLINAKQTLQNIDRYQDIAEKWDAKIFGKAKFREEHRSEKWQYDNSVKELKEYGITDKFDLRQQECIHENRIKEVEPRLQVEKEQITPTINILSGALQAFENALRSEKYQQRQETIKLTKALKRNHREEGIDFSR